MTKKKLKQSQKVRKRKRNSGVYADLANARAFFDKVVLNIRGTLRKRPQPRLRGKKSLAIGGPGRFYARCLPRRDSLSHNKLQLKYGLLRRFGNISPYVFSMWAGGSPVTLSAVVLALEALFRSGYRATVSAVELTFDVAGISLESLAGELCARAGVRWFSDKDGRETLYVGSPRSPYQLRIYQKTWSIVRIEFVLRNGFLRRCGMRRPQDLLLLKRAPLWKTVGFREIDQSDGDELPPRIRKPWIELGHGLPPNDVPASIILGVLREMRIDPSRWLVPSDRERLLRRMQRHLIW